MTEIHALRDAYRRDKAALLSAMQATGASTRGIRVVLRKLSALAGNLLHTLWQRAGLRCSPVWWGATAGRGQGNPHGYNASQYRRGHGSVQRQSPSAGPVRPPSFRP